MVFLACVRLALFLASALSPGNSVEVILMKIRQRSAINGPAERQIEARAEQNNSIATVNDLGVSGGRRRADARRMRTG